MKIALVSSISKPTHLESEGGIEVFNTNFILESIKKNIFFDLYAIGGSIENESVKLIKVIPKPIENFLSDQYFLIPKDQKETKKIQFISTIYTRILSLIKKNENNYDLIIDSASYPNFTFNTFLFEKPVITIGHFSIDLNLEYYSKNFQIPSNLFFIFPSKSQYEKSDFIPETQKKYIPHGIPLANFDLNQKGGNEIIWLSRIHRFTNKGLIEAIKVASLIRRKLTAYGYLELSSVDYFNKKIKPLLNSQFIELNLHKPSHNLSKEQKKEILKNGKLFLFPIQWEEPFGLVMIESMACGTPVIAFARGSVPEVIKDGETGFIVNPSDDDIRGNWIIKKTGIDGLCEAVERIYSMPEKEYQEMRYNCRKHVEKHFTVERMVDDYIKVYQEVIKKNSF